MEVITQVAVRQANSLTNHRIVRQTRVSRRAAESQMDFVAGVLHELRTPPAVVRGAARHLAKGVVQEPERSRTTAQVWGSASFGKSCRRTAGPSR